AAAGRGQTSPLMRMPFRSRQQNYFFCIPFRYNNFQIYKSDYSEICLRLFNLLLNLSELNSLNI
ncbi:hypothetical protein ACUWFG_34055, partial [Escherichia coli]